ncbi:MAG: hypothetical protein IJ836_04850 [Spirochaetales bacterium]|nr:hypothetical protein [Spirochaetales bacterium]
MNEALRLYVERKIGKGQKISWCLKSYLSCLLVLLVSAALAFTLVFVSSMTKAIDSTLQSLGSGSIAVYDTLPDVEIEGSVKKTERAGGLLYSKDKSQIVYIKGTEEDYFTPDISSFIKLESVENNTGLKGIRISRIMASRLGAHLGDKLTVMLYDTALGRVRPVLVFLEGTYSSGYNEFDSNLAYTSIDVTDGQIVYEIRCEDVDKTLSKLLLEGADAVSYKSLYRSIYNNLATSKDLLLVITILVAFLAGFFSISVSYEYIERDRRDIGGLLMLGFEKRSIIASYRYITLISVGISALVGEVVGILLSFLVSPILSSLDITRYPVLQNYVLSFEIVIPFKTLSLLFIALILSSYLSLRFALTRRVFSSLSSALR